MYINFPKTGCEPSGVFFSSSEKQKQNCSPSFFTCYQGPAVAPFHVSSDHTLRWGQVSSNIGFPAVTRELSMFPPVFLKCPSASSVFCCVCMSPENSCACWWPLSSDPTKKLHVSSLCHHFTGDAPRGKKAVMLSWRVMHSQVGF